MKKIEYPSEEVNDLLHFLAIQKWVTIEEVADLVSTQVIDIIERLKDIKLYSHNIKKVK
jgi:hypothetical protein